MLVFASMHNILQNMKCVKVDGSGLLEAFDCARECGIPLCDRHNFVLGMKVLSTLHQLAVTQRFALRVSVLSASHLAKTDLFGSVDMNVTLVLEDKVTGMAQSHKSCVIEDSYEPRWENESFVFPLRDMDDPGEMIISDYDHDLLTNDDLIGAYLMGEIFTSLPVRH